MYLTSLEREKYELSCVIVRGIVPPLHAITHLTARDPLSILKYTVQVDIFVISN